MGIKSQMEMVLARLLAGGGVAALFTFGTESTMLALCGSIAPRVAKLRPGLDVNFFAKWAL
jgi:hypothetical protein